MRQGLLFTLVCVVIAIVFVALAYWPSSPNSTASGTLSPLEKEVVEGPIQNGVLVEGNGVARAVRDSSGGGYVLEVSDRVVVPEGPVDDVVRQLRPRAEAGDAKASLMLYRKLDACFSAANRGVSADEIAIFEAMGSADQFEASIANAQKDCATNGISDFRSRGQWLERAAANGLLEAKLQYATDIDAIFSNPSEMIRDPQRLTDYKQKAVRYMSDLAASGNIESMMWIAKSYESGIMLERNPVNSYAYYRAVELAMPGVMPSGMLSGLRELLPANEQRRGEELARSIHGRCCG